MTDPIPADRRKELDAAARQLADAEAETARQCGLVPPASQPGGLGAPPYGAAIGLVAVVGVIAAVTIAVNTNPAVGILAGCTVALLGIIAALLYVMWRNSPHLRR